MIEQAVLDIQPSRGCVVKGNPHTVGGVDVKKLVDKNNKRKRVGIVYRYLFPNGKNYIGQTWQSVSKRVKQHFYDSETRARSPIQRALLKYPVKKIFILAVGYSKKEIDGLEKYWISEYKSSVRDSGYNIQMGGRNSFKYAEGYRKDPINIRLHSKETKRKMKQLHLKLWEKRKMSNDGKQFYFIL